MWRVGLLLVAIGSVAELAGLLLPWGRDMSLATLLTWPAEEAGRVPLGLVGAVGTLCAALWVLSGRGSMPLRRMLVGCTGTVQLSGLFAVLTWPDAPGAWTFTAGAVCVLVGGLSAYRHGIPSAAGRAAR